MCPYTWLDTNVYEAALNRIRFVFDECDDVLVAMSGGKDSTVLFHLARTVAIERGRLPIKVFWLDQEAEWKATEEYMKGIMYSEEVIPYWWQIPFRLTNSLSFTDNYLNVWSPDERGLWLREQDPISLKVSPFPDIDRFKPLSKHIPKACDTEGKKLVGVLLGLRAVESANRRACLHFHVRKTYKGIMWQKPLWENIRGFWPLHDWSDSDIWTAIARNKLAYNRIYDLYYKYGIVGLKMRVSALIHETAWHSIEPLQQLEPDMYDRYIRRLHGVNTFKHFKDYIIPPSLPMFFKDWTEYRDYLLQHIIEPEHREIFVRRWKNQVSEQWSKQHIRELVVNDVDGTINGNSRTRIRMNRKKLAGGKFETEKRQRLDRYFAEHTTQSGVERAMDTD